MSTQTLQPLIWLARRRISSSVRNGAPPFSTDFPRASIACKASGTIIARLFILALIVAILLLLFPFQLLLTPNRLGAYSSGLIYGLQLHDEWESRNRTCVKLQAQKISRRAFGGEKNDKARRLLGGPSRRKP